MKGKLSKIFFQKCASN